MKAETIGVLISHVGMDLIMRTKPKLLPVAMERSEKVMQSRIKTFHGQHDSYYGAGEV